MSKLFHRALIAGTGPVAVQLAVMLKRYWKCTVGIAGRQSVRSAPFFDALRQSDSIVRAEVQNSQHHGLEGEYQIDSVYDSYELVAGQWDVLILSVTADAYVHVLELLQRQVLHRLQCVVLISPTFGSNALVTEYLQENRCTAEVLSFSTYLGDTRRLDDKPFNYVLTTAVKRKVYAGAAFTDCETAAIESAQSAEAFQELYRDAGISLEVVNSPLEAETRNISLYVHPPLFMNEISLGVIFDRPAVPKFVYKLFPEGPITMQLIKELLRQWEEISALVRKLGGAPVNLLQFMVDDNYPVRPESLPRHEIDRFPQLSPVQQQYLLFVRYASLLIDPFSEPDEAGKYFDFSAVPIRHIFINHEGAWDIPRMPKEDYYRIKIIQGIAKDAGLQCPMIDAFIDRYEHMLSAAARKLQGETLSEAFTIQSFERDIRRICRQLLPSIRGSHKQP